MTTKQSAISAAITDAGALQLTFANGKVINVYPDMLTAEIQRAALLHGLKQKLVDAAAITRNTETGLSASIEDKYQAVLDVYNRITRADGTWNSLREGGGSGTLLYRALVRFFANRMDAEQVREWLDARTDDERKALRTNPRVAAIIVRLQAEAAKSGGVDSDALLDAIDQE